MREVVDAVEFRRRWNNLLRRLKRLHPDWSGLRVFEEHPGGFWGRSHGMHVHCVTNARFEVAPIRARCIREGWGRCHVIRWKSKNGTTAGAYLAKYLTKKRPPHLKGWRLWAAFNLPNYTRVAQVKRECQYSFIWRYLSGREDFACQGYFEKSRRVSEIAWRSVAEGITWDANGPSLVHARTHIRGYPLEQIELALNDRRWEKERGRAKIFQGKNSLATWDSSGSDPVQ